MQFCTFSISLSLTGAQIVAEREREMEDLEEEEKVGEEVLGSSLTMEKVAAAKKFIENHYRAQMKNIQERKERYIYLHISIYRFA